MTGPGRAEGGRGVVHALRAAVGRPSGRLGELLDEAVGHLEVVLRERPPETVAAVAVPLAVCAALRTAPTRGLLAAAAATYLAVDVLDDRMDGDEPAFWRGRQPGEVVIGAQVLLQSAAHVVADGAAPAAAERMRASYQDMGREMAEGQLLSGRVLDETTTPADVIAAVSARSGSMLAGFAGMAAIASGADEATVAAARAFGHELGVARQHVNDVTELLGERTTDLRNRTPTLAAAFALQTLDPAGRRRLIETVRAAVDDPAVRRRLVVDELDTAISDVVVMVELHLGRARREAASVDRSDPGDRSMHHLVDYTAASLRRNDAR